MKNASEEVLATAVQMKRDGQKWPAILKATGLNHVQAELAWIRANITPEQFANAEALVAKIGLAATCVELRDAQNSWGTIAAMVGESESAVRRMYTEASNLKSKGNRIGHGGRFYLGDEVLYTEGLKPTGTLIPKDAVGREGARRVAAVQRIAKLNRAELVSLAADYGIDPKGKTPARIAGLIHAEMGLIDPKPAKKARKVTAAPALEVEGEVA